MKNIRNLFEQLNSTSRELALSRQALELYERTGLPSRKDEDWKYTSLKKLSEQEFLKASDAQTLAVSEIKSALCAEDIFVKTFAQAMRDGDVAAIENNSPFELLNSSFFEDGIYIKFNKNHDGGPLVLKHAIRSPSDFFSPRVHIDVGENNSIEIHEYFESKNSDCYFMNSFSTINIGKSSSVKMFRFFNENSNASHVDQVKAEVASGGRFELFFLGKGTQLTRSNIHVNLAGEGAQANVFGLTLLKEKNQMDHFVSIKHTYRETHSRQIFKSLLADESHYVFQGHIQIDREAQKSDAGQVNKNLLLSRNSRVDTKPKLDVFADDVKATHGATVGQLDKEELFYLESRGISPDKARAILCEGFAHDIVEKIESFKIKEISKKFIGEQLV